MDLEKTQNYIKIIIQAFVIIGAVLIILNILIQKKIDNKNKNYGKIQAESSEEINTDPFSENGSNIRIVTGSNSIDLNSESLRTKPLEIPWARCADEENSQVSIRIDGTKILVTAEVFNYDSKSVAKIQDNNWKITPPGYEKYFDGHSLEIIDDYGVIVLQVSYELENNIQINGVFRCPDGSNKILGTTSSQGQHFTSPDVYRKKVRELISPIFDKDGKRIENEYLKKQTLENKKLKAQFDENQQQIVNYSPKEFSENLDNLIKKLEEFWTQSSAITNNNLDNNLSFDESVNSINENSQIFRSTYKDNFEIKSIIYLRILQSKLPDVEIERYDRNIAGHVINTLTLKKLISILKIYNSNLKI